MAPDEAINNIETDRVNGSIEWNQALSTSKNMMPSGTRNFVIVPTGR